MKALLFFVALSLLKVSSAEDATNNNTDSNSSKKMRCHQCDGKVPEALELLLLRTSNHSVKDYVMKKKNYCTGDFIAKYISDAKRCKTNEICYTMTVKKSST